MKSDSVHLRHILECIRRIEENAEPGHTAFLASHTLQDAVLRNLQTMAESTQRLTESLKAKHAEVDWTSIGAFRNVLAHGYLGIDLERIWHIVESDVPPLRDAAAAILREVAD